MGALAKISASRSQCIVDAVPKILGEACIKISRDTGREVPHCRLLYRGLLARDKIVPYAIAIPARNERDRVIACLEACLKSMEHNREFGAVVLLVNNTSDQTERLAVRWASGAGLPIEVILAELPSGLAHAGAARHLALERARALVGPDGALLTTDADSLPATSWISENLGELSRGDALVCGDVDFDEMEVASLPPGTLETGTSENLYTSLAGELASLIDPDPYNPWPHHGQVFGASLAMTAKAYDKVGGIPLITCGEDRALARAFRTCGFPVKHSARPRVITSCRLDGRAPGGMADTIASRRHEDNFLCDEILEPAEAVERRATLRRAVRTALATGGNMESVLIALDLQAADLEVAQSISCFEVLWAFLERQSPLFVRSQMRCHELEDEIPRIQAMLDRYRQNERGS